MKRLVGMLLVCLLVGGGTLCASAQVAQTPSQPDVPVRTLELPPGAGNSRNSEGAFVTLKDGRVMMFIRASGGCQYIAYSSDGCDTWSVPVASDILSPVSPASIKRLPSTGDLLLVWNDHVSIPPSLKIQRVPLSTAISRDDGRSWQHTKVLEGNPRGHYCYITIHPVGDAVLLGYCAMSELGHSHVNRVPVAWLYADKPDICLHGYLSD